HLAGLQRVDGVPRLGPQLVLQDEQSGQLAVDGDERRGAAHPVSAALVGVGRRQAYGAGFHEAATTDQHVAAFDVDVDAEANPRVRPTSRSARRSAHTWMSGFSSAAASIAWTMRPTAVSRPTRSTRTSISPYSTRVAANTASPFRRSTGNASPVIVC